MVICTPKNFRYLIRLKLHSLQTRFSYWIGILKMGYVQMGKEWVEWDGSEVCGLSWGTVEYIFGLVK